MTPEEQLDEARAKEAGGDPVKAARLAREGWTPPKPVDSDILAFREWVDSDMLAFREWVETSPYRYDAVGLRKAFLAGAAASEARIKALEARVAAFEHESKRLEPYLDAIICYASTRSEHEPNDIVFSIRALLKEADQ